MLQELGELMDLQGLESRFKEGFDSKNLKIKIIFYKIINLIN
jgi:hypothetical protein